jgi:predicted nucleic acid-binding protein
LWESAHPVASSLLAYPEGRAALAAARRSGRLTAAGHRRAVEEFDATCAELHMVAIDERLAAQAGELADRLGLRSYDAVHLASALTLSPGTTVVTWDAELGAAAHGSGLAVAPYDS